MINVLPNAGDEFLEKLLINWGTEKKLCVTLSDCGSSIKSHMNSLLLLWQKWFWLLSGGFPIGNTAWFRRSDGISAQLLSCATALSCAPILWADSGPSRIGGLNKSWKKFKFLCLLCNVLNMKLKSGRSICSEFQPFKSRSSARSEDRPYRAKVLFPMPVTD